MINENKNLAPGEARDALESAAKMEGAGWRRAVSGRWFGAGIPMLIGSMFAIFGSIVIRRTYDAAWVSVVAGMPVGLIVFLASESERRACLAKAGGGQE
jgi:hypothetical protein